MERALLALQEDFVARTRERLAATMSEIAGAGSTRVVACAARRQFLETGHLAALHGLLSISGKARRGDEDVTTALVAGWAGDPAFAVRWKAVLAAIDDELGAVATPGPAAGADGPRVMFLAGEAEGRDALPFGRPDLGPTVCDVACDVEAAIRVLASKPVVAILVDVSSPPPGLDGLLGRIRSRQRLFRPVPPVIGLARGQGLIDRFRLRADGVAAMLAADAPAREIAGVVGKVVDGLEFRRGTVFLLGPDEGLKDGLSADLATDGFVVESFSTIQAMLTRWLERAPQMIVANGVKGGPGALRFVRELRNDPGARRVPIIMATDHVDIDMRRAIASSGADDFLPVPYVEGELARIRSLMDIARMVGVWAGIDA